MPIVIRTYKRIFEVTKLGYNTIEAKVNPPPFPFSAYSPIIYNSVGSDTAFILPSLKHEHYFRKQ